MQVKVARIGRPHGIRGEVTVQLFTDEPEKRFAPGAVLSVRPGHALAPAGRLTVAGSRWNKTILVVRFEQVTSRNEAEALRDQELCVEAETAEEQDAYYEHDLIGLPVYAVQDADQEELEDRIGEVAGLQTMPFQDLLRIELTDGQEVLIPFVQQIVPEVNVEEGFVVVLPPEGLLRLNREDDGQ